MPQPGVELLTMAPGLLAIGPAGVEQLGRAPRDLGSLGQAVLAGDQRVRMTCQKMQIGGDDRGFERLARVQRLAERRQCLAQDFTKPVGVLPRDQVSVGGQGHGRAEGDRRFAGDVLVGYLAQAAGLGQPDRAIDASRIVDRGGCQDRFNPLGKIDAHRERPPRGPAAGRCRGSCSC